MPIPKIEECLLPVLQTLADGRAHSVEEIRKSLRAKFVVTRDELALKHKNGVSIFVNTVAWALAHLNMREGQIGHATAITLVGRGTYRLTDHGKAILSGNPSSLTINDLRQ